MLSNKHPVKSSDSNIPVILYIASAQENDLEFMMSTPSSTIICTKATLIADGIWENVMSCHVELLF